MAWTLGAHSQAQSMALPLAAPLRECLCAQEGSTCIPMAKAALPAMVGTLTQSLFIKDVHFFMLRLPDALCCYRHCRQLHDVNPSCRLHGRPPTKITVPHMHWFVCCHRLQRQSDVYTACAIPTSHCRNPGVLNSQCHLSTSRH